MYDQIITDLRQAYNSSAGKRDKAVKESWKLIERQHFLSLLRQEGKKSLLEIGAGTGQDSQFFQEKGLDVVCTDLSPEMIQRCQEKGLAAYVMDFLHLDFSAASFDAVYALNCLLHVPGSDLAAVLQSIQKLLKPSGLFFLGVYGGIEREGIVPEDYHEPPRFFSYHKDDYMRAAVAPFFEILSFKALPLESPRAGGDDEGFHFQSIILRKP